MTKAKTETVASNKRDVADIGGIPVYCRYDEAVDIEKVTGHPRNPNKHGEDQIALLAKIIKNSGWRNPICVSNSVPPNLMRAIATHIKENILTHA